MAEPVGILSLRDVRGVGLNPKHRFIMQDRLRSLYSNDWLEGLNDDQIYDLFEENDRAARIESHKLSETT